MSKIKIDIKEKVEIKEEVLFDDIKRFDFYIEYDKSHNVSVFDHASEIEDDSIILAEFPEVIRKTIKMLLLLQTKYLKSLKNLSGE